MAAKAASGMHEHGTAFRKVDPFPDIRAPLPASQLQTLIHLRTDLYPGAIFPHDCRDEEGSRTVRSRGTPMAIIAREGWMMAQGLER